MSKEQKKLSERKHKMVHNFLVEQFPGCTVEYDGVRGVDHRIIFNNVTVLLETKTCKKIIRGGVKIDTVRPVLHQKIRLGRLKFDQRKLLAYEFSQHGDLVRNNGWYVFVIGGKNISGISAREVDKLIGGYWKLKRVSWDKILGICYPNWLEHLKIRVYGVKKF